MNTGFDSEQYREIDEARWRFFEPLLRQLIPMAGVRHVLDIGAGAGFFSERIAALGVDVTATDGRAENVAEIGRRYPTLKTAVIDVQVDDALARVGPVDLIFCAGLLYHLDNPVAAFRSLGRAQARLLLIETQLIPDRAPCFRLVEEGVAETQGLQHLALVPSEQTLVRLLHLFGWTHVYCVPGRPDHWQFHESSRRHQLRSIFLASRQAMPQLSFAVIESQKAGKGFQEKHRPLFVRVVDKLCGR